ncbi:MAG: PepSY domain-containing protein, partial [Ferrovibrio sp.]
RPKSMPIEPGVSYGAIHAAAMAEGERRGWTIPPGALLYAADYGIYQVRYFQPGHERGAPGLGAARLYFDGADGRLLGERVPGTGTAADIVIQAQFPVHSGRILGLPGRILVSLMGLVTAALAVTGVLIWARKRRRGVDNPRSAAI